MMTKHPEGVPYILCDPSRSAGCRADRGSFLHLLDTPKRASSGQARRLRRRPATHVVNFEQIQMGTDVRVEVLVQGARRNSARIRDSSVRITRSARQR